MLVSAGTLRHDEFSAPVRDAIKAFNTREGKGAGAFRIVAYWSRGDMSMHTAGEDGKKINAAALKVMSSPLPRAWCHRTCGQSRCHLQPRLSTSFQSLRVFR